ncbi:MAG: hypothetical protein AAF850_05650 [Pseudomonadota bacterium]
MRRLITRRRPIAISSALAAIAVTQAGCTATPNTDDGAEDVAEEVACPVTITTASAWVNRMPGPDAKPRLHVVASLEGVGAGISTLQRSEEQPGDALHLTMALEANAGDGDLTTAEVRYSELADAPPSGGVVITCGGTTIKTIETIEIVY